MNRLNRWAALLAGVTLLVMSLIGCADVVATQFLDLPIPAALELVETLLVASIFLAISHAQKERRHIQVNAVLNHLSPGARQACLAFGDLCTLVLFSMIAWYAWKSAAHSLSVGEFKSGLISFPLWPARITLAIGASLMLLQAAVDLKGRLRSLARRSPVA